MSLLLTSDSSACNRANRWYRTVAMAGIGSLIYVPLSNVYGRRPVLLFAQALAAAAGFGSAAGKTFGTIVCGRAFVGLGVAASNVLTISIVSDIFCRKSKSPVT